MQTLPREDFPTLPMRAARRARYSQRAGGEGDGRQDAVRDHRGGYALFPERRTVRLESRMAMSSGRHRRSPAGAGDGAPRRQGREGSGGEQSHPAEEDARRTRPPAERRRRRHHAMSAVRTTCSSRSAERLLISRMIDGQFPAYERVIPKGNDKHIEFDRDRLTSAVKRVALLSNERSRAVKIQIEKGKVDVTSSSPDLGEAKETLPVGLQRPADADLFQRAVRRSTFLAAVDNRRRVARIEGRSQPGRHEAGRRRGIRLHLVIMPMRV